MKRISIRVRIILWLSLAMIVVSVLTFLLTTMISETVMQKALRGYLISTVEANTDKLSYYPGKLTEEAQKQDPDDIFIEYKEGYIQIDDDFLDVMHDVESALYQADGSMLYGKNPVARKMREIAFTQTRITQTVIDKEMFFYYDRKLSGDCLDGLWIRGVVSMKEEKQELMEIVRIMILFIPLLFVGAGIMGFLSSRSILRPLREVQRTAEEIADGNDLKKRVPYKGRNDEIGKMANTINDMLDRLEDSFETEQQFSSDVSHELRTPVSVILAQAELSLGKERTLPEYQSALQVIRRQAGRMQTLVSEMLEYTRLYQRAGEYTMEKIDLSKLTRAVCEDISLAGRNGIVLEPTIQPDIFVKGNQMLLSRMLQNLIDNAFKYGKENGHIWVTLSSRKEVLLIVKDDGIGISRSNQEKIFQRFFRDDAARSKTDNTGYGLGLAMVDKIVQMHNARIELKSEEGVGTSIIICFPAL